MSFIQNILGSTESLPLKPTQFSLHNKCKTLLKDHNLRTSMLRNTRIAGTTFMCSPCVYTPGLCLTAGSHVMFLPPNPFLLTLSMDGALQASSCPELYTVFIVWWCSADCLKLQGFSYGAHHSATPVLCKHYFPEHNFPFFTAEEARWEG